MVLSLAVLSTATGCLRGLVHDPGAKAVALGPEGVWPIHATSSRPHWLLRSAPGWQSAHQVGYGLLNAGEAVAVVRAVVFADEESAIAGFEKLTPEYLVRSFPSEIALMPWLDPLQSDEPAAQVEAYTYFIPLPFAPNVPSPFPGRLVKMRQGRVVAVYSSIGLSDAQLAAGAAAMAREADALGSARATAP